MPQIAESPTVEPGLATSPAVAYYVDSPLDEEGGAAADAQIDFSMGDLEQLFQEQLASLAQDVAEHETAQKKGKAVATDPSIMVLEEDLALEAPVRPDELITLQLGSGSRWFVQRMPHLDNAAGGSTLISCRPDISLVGTPEHADATTQ